MKDFKPLVDRNQTNSLALAEAERDRVYDLLVNAAAGKDAEVLALKSPPYTSPPWIRIEAWARHANDALVTARMTVVIELRTREFHRFPVEMDVLVYNGAKRKRYLSIVEFSQSQADRLIDYLIDPEVAQKFGFSYRRKWVVDIWRAKNKPVRLGLDPMKLAILVLAVLGLLTLEFGIGVLLLAAAGWLLIRGRSTQRRYTLSAGKPAQDPRMPIRMDSWQTVISGGVGMGATSIRDELLRLLQKFQPEGFEASSENIWYLGVEGKEEREQIVVRFRRAILFLHVYRYGDDLFIGWDAHVNCGEWIEKVIGDGYDKSVGLLCEIRSIQAGWRVPNEYDVTDANCLIERVHALVTKSVKLKVAEYKIDQEIDFKILREPREGIAGRKEPEPARRLFKRLG
jgi:hypothetical protein